jgi:hypothetical protein
MILGRHENLQKMIGSFILWIKSRFFNRDKRGKDFQMTPEGIEPSTY